MPSSVQISDEDIQIIGEEFDCDFSDDSRRQALLGTTSMDVQACPGSGKTMLLVAKLAILAKKWLWRDRGILVLSHTNVARETVEKRLARHPCGYKMLSYPHFIGTIQRFIDEFLALAFLKNFYGVGKVTVDDDRFAKMSITAMQRCYKLKTFLKNRYDGEEVIKTVRFEYDKGLCLGCGSGNFPFKSTNSDSYKQLEALKLELTQKGYVRFDDMFAFAHEYLRSIPMLLEAIRIRFPWVFIDEMQDTSSFQDNVLQKIFAGNSIVQRFGDINQAIFIAGRAEESQQSFPGDCMVDLSSSKRFGCQIAHLCSPVSSVSCQILEGNCSRSDRKNSIILFDKNSIFKVLPTFGQLIHEELGSETGRRLVAKAIGFRKRPRTTSGSKYLPHDIGDYWPLFDSAFTKNLGGENFLLDYVIKARSVLAATKECLEACKLIIEGLLRLAEELKLVDSNGGKITKSVLLRTIKDSPDVIRKHYDSILYSFCIDNTSIQADTWKTMVKEAIEFITELFPMEKQADVEDFINWDERLTVPEEIENPNVPNRRNIYMYKLDGFEYDIEVTTIHSVKGETHDATLLLETCFKRSHDLRKTIPFLAADGNDCASADSSTKEYLKRIYVAMTRPRELLCLALLKDHLGPNKKARGDNETRLRAKGWRLIDLTGDS
ncbi:MAG: UvrD-helicase domain-containing protein [Candidatus Hodarchaeota archaeon]